MNVVTLNHLHADLSAVLNQQGLSTLLPAHITPEQFISTAAQAMLENSELQDAEPGSRLLALTRCARDGLLPDGREAALVVRRSKNNRGQYEKQVAYLPMVDGVLKRARQSGQVANIISKVVYEGDEFKYWVDERGEHLKHVPQFDERGDLRLVYAFAKLTSGELVVEVMVKSEIDKVRAASRSGSSAHSPWQVWYDRMALKTVLHRLARRLPCASELCSLLEVRDDTPEAEKPLSMAHSAKSGQRLREALGKVKFSPHATVNPAPLGLAAEHGRLNAAGDSGGGSAGAVVTSKQQLNKKMTVDGTEAMSPFTDSAASTGRFPYRNTETHGIAPPSQFVFPPAASYPCYDKDNGDIGITQNATGRNNRDDHVTFPPRQPV